MLVSNATPANCEIPNASKMGTQPDFNACWQALSLAAMHHKQGSAAKAHTNNTTGATVGIPLEVLNQSMPDATAANKTKEETDRHPNVIAHEKCMPPVW